MAKLFQCNPEWQNLVQHRGPTSHLSTSDSQAPHGITALALPVPLNHLELDLQHDEIHQITTA